VIRAAAVVLTFLTAVTASAQQPLFDPDDFLDPRATDGRPVLISRLVIGAGSNLSGDGFRPLGEHVGYVHLANSFSWRSVQFDYQRSELRAEGGEAAVWQEIQQPKRTLQTRNATPTSKDTLHAAWYWPIPAGGGSIPVILRTRVTFATQQIETIVVNSPTSVTPMSGREPTVVFPGSATHMSGRERTFAIDTDTWFRLCGHDVFGTLALSRTKTTGTLADRDERALTYTNRFPAFSYDRAKIVIRPTLTIGGTSKRAGSAVNLVNPSIEIFRPFVHTGANLHVIWSPQWTANGADRKVRHQVAVLIDRALFVKVF
jgi:hypothetical protein